MTVEIISRRFLIRDLGVDDVTERYLGWFDDPEARKYIAAAAQTRQLSDLKKFVQERLNKPEVLFLGIFDRSTGFHVGNIKYEPVDSAQGYAVMGILIGEPAYRGQGVTPEVLTATGQWLKEHRNISQIILGVNRDNRGAIRAYEKAGFVVAPTPYLAQSLHSLTMVRSF